MQCDLFNLKGRSALVTGGSRGLGKAMARGFAECGAKVMICSRNETELQSAAREISDRLDAEVRYVVTDMARRDEVDALAAAAL